MSCMKFEGQKQVIGNYNKGNSKDFNILDT